MNTAQKKQYLDTASRLGFAICRDAIWNNDTCNWIGSTNEDFMGAPKVFARSLQSNFYDGTAGVAFFLTQLSKVNDDRIIKETAEGSLNHLIKSAGENKEENFGKLGFHTGYPGQAWVMHHAADILGKKKYQEAAIDLIEKTISIPPESWTLDIIDGAAGAIPCLIALYKHYPGRQLKDFIITLGDYLKKNSIRQGATIAWDTLGGTSKPLTGFGHGAAGIATALIELSAFTGDNDYMNIAARGFAYENNHFNHQHQNWPDFRSHMTAYQQAGTEQEENCGIAWCHGAPGIALSRLRAYDITGAEEWKQDAETAVATTLKHFGYDSLGNFSLCHGLFGNAEILLYAAEVLNKNELNSIVEKAVMQALDQTFSKNNPVANGLHNYNDTPDFMLGTSGMGYFFLRMYNPEIFQSALMLKA